ncbi:MAG TPA: AAA family ATPase, partial [Chromatiaceae bacterium]|nr:AAA family ATPase [Chromatiaceae bacterium]
PGLGQERALEAIDLGVNVPHRGYNLYLMGSGGLGKHALIKGFLEQRRRESPAPDDWCYVADFNNPQRPYALRLPPGRGRHLRADLCQLVDDLLNAVPAAFQGEEYLRRAEEIQREFKSREEDAATAIGHQAKEQGIALLHTPTGYTLAPMREGHILAPEDFNALPEEEREHIGEVIEELREALQQTLSQVPLWQKEMRGRFKILNQETMEGTVTALMGQLAADYADLPAVHDYLAAARKDMIEHGDLFRQGDGEEGRAPRPDDPPFTRYRVNLLVDNAELRGAPVVHEDNPSYLNLIGRIEHIAHQGTLSTDFTLIKAGALHRANGGYLILDALRLLANPFAWDALKRVLRAGEIRIESLERVLSLAGTTSLEPEPIPVEVKVILVGERLLYYLLDAYDPDFAQLFKVAADFAEEMPRLPGQDPIYARLVATLQRQERLLPLTPSGVARVIEQAARRVADRERLSMHVGGLLDLLRESDHLARRERLERIGEEQVEGAIAARRRRLGQLRERLHEEILRGTLLIDTKGSQLGQVNGLSVIALGDHAFGTPTRISATARLGQGEVVDIQREIEQAGPIHSKGVLILAGYLGRRYARFQPLCLSASLVFEQTYGLVEGDSASVAELCALLSAIGDIPLKQALAITGSVNQHGEVQAIGGVNEKIEGFFDICQARGLTGEEGVIIPQANRKHLMLNKAVRAAVASGDFNVHAVAHVDQALELLTGQAAGLPDQDGLYPTDSINGQIQERLATFFAVRQQINRNREEDND